MERWKLLIVLWLISIVVGIVAGLVFVKLTTNTTFVFGIHTNAFVTNTIGDPYQPDNVDKALKLAKQLGVTHLRVNYEGQNLDSINDDFIDRVVRAGFVPVLIVESPLPAERFFAQETYERGFDLGQRVGTRYLGKVNYFQLANEVSGMTIKPLNAGRQLADYDEKKYEALRRWITGLADGIKAANPQAKRIVSSNWIATAVIDELIKDKVQFEVIGWNWFSDMGDDPTNKVLDDGTVLNIPGHFAKTGKQFWFVELNQAAGSLKGEQAQAKFLSKFFDNIKKSPYVHGLFGYTLVDFAPYKPIDDRLWGFIKLEEDAPNHFSPGDPKPVFYEYQKIIRD